MTKLVSSNASLYLLHPTPDRFLWNTLIRAAGASAPLLYVHMRRHAVKPDLYTFPFLLHSLSSPENLSLGQTLHAHILSSGFLSCNIAQNSLLNMYSLCGDLNCAENLFLEIVSPDLPTWNSFLKAHLRGGAIRQACKLFDEMPDRNVISWTCMIDGLVKGGEDRRALGVFRGMLGSGGATPNEFTMSAVLAACGNIGALEQGKWVHRYIRKSGMSVDAVLGTCLIDMYAKCGSIDRAYQVFDEIPERDVQMWSSMIAGFAFHGRTNQSLALFEQMIVLGVAPNAVTFIGILSACAHSGWIEKGEAIFNRMRSDFGILPSIQHYGCLVDLYARAGLVRKAMDIVNSMPMEPDLLVWGALLSGSRIHGIVDACQISLEKMVSMDPNNSTAHVLLSNLYAKLGRWTEARQIRGMMEERGIRKTPGCSLVEIDGVIHEFSADLEDDERDDVSIDCIRTC